MDLERYFDRIGYRGGTAATVETLSHLLADHMRAIPFENLDVLLGQPPRLDLPSLEDKLVVSRRGGYCYEHSTLFAAVLASLGFEVRTHSARVVMATPRGQAPRTHMFLTVGDLMLDPGFGGLAPRVPVPLDGSAAGEHRLVRDGNEIVLEHAGKRLWTSSLEHDIPIDFEMANHYTATHPRSHFTQRLMMRAFTRDGQVRVMNRDVTVIRGGESQAHQLADRAALRRLVAEYFGFDLPAIEAMKILMVPEWA